MNGARVRYDEKSITAHIIKRTKIGTEQNRVDMMGARQPVRHSEIPVVGAYRATGKRVRLYESGNERDIAYDAPISERESPS